METIEKCKVNETFKNIFTQVVGGVNMSEYL